MQASRQKDFQTKSSPPDQLLTKHEGETWTFPDMPELDNFTSCGRSLRKPLEDVFPSKPRGKKRGKGQHITQEMRSYSERAADEWFRVMAVREVWAQPVLIRMQRPKFSGGRSSRQQTNKQTNKQMQMIIWWFGPGNKQAREKVFIRNGVNEKKWDNVWLRVRQNAVR